MRRVSVVGSSCSGKTTFARALARAIDVPCVEIDALNWEPGWTIVSPEALRARVDEATSADAWVVDGSYGAVRDMVWSRADTVVWLDAPFWLILSRLWRRTLRRIRSGEELWNGNRETFRGAFLSRDSLFVWVLRTQRRRARLYLEQLARPEFAHLTVHASATRATPSAGSRRNARTPPSVYRADGDARDDARD